MRTLAEYLFAYLCLLACLIYLWHRWYSLFGREPNGVDHGPSVLVSPHHDAMPFEPVDAGSSRPDESWSRTLDDIRAL